MVWVKNLKVGVKMRLITFSLSALFFTSCQSLPQFYQAAEDIANDTAIGIEVSKEAIAGGKDIQVQVNVKNVTK